MLWPEILVVVKVVTVMIMRGGWEQEGEDGSRREKMGDRWEHEAEDGIRRERGWERDSDDTMTLLS